MKAAYTKTFWGLVFSAVFLVSAGTAHAQNLYIEDVVAQDGDTITVPIMLEQAPNEANSFGLELTFDSARLDFINTSSAGTLTKDMFVNGNLKEAGVLTIGGFLDFFSFQLCAPDGTLCPSGISAGANEVLINVVFQVTACGNGPLGLQSLADDFNPDIGAWSTADGTFACGDYPGCTEGATQLCDSGLPGACAQSSQTCDANGNWGGCVQVVASSAEVCDGIDNDCNGDVDDDVACDAGTVTTVQLNEGWNLISLNLQPDNTARDDVLTTIAGKYKSIWYFTNGGWVFYNNEFGFGQLTTVEAGWGYWIDMSEAGTLTVSGTDPSTTIELGDGWNLVGCNSSTPMLRDDAVTSINTQYESIWNFVNGSWLFYNAQFGFGELQTVEPRKGYWIKTTEACTWTLP